MKKFTMIFLFVLFVALILSSVTYARSNQDEYDFRGDVDSSEIAGAADNFVGTLIFTYLPIAGFLGMAISGLSLIFGKAEGKEKLLYVILGVSVACLGPAIIMHLVNLFGGIYGR
ncbi:MAG: TrbC/VirB2 family protein [archaeon]